MSVANAKSQNTEQSNNTPLPSNVLSFQAPSLYVGDLAPDVNETTLYELFSQVGHVASIRICRDAVTRRSLGYGYVNFHTPAEADRAIEQLNSQLIKGRPVRIMWSQRDPSMRKSGKGNVFIKNLAKDIDQKALIDTFSQFGNILSCKIELDNENNSKGYGYIQFQTQEAADQAISMVNGKMLKDKQVFVGPFQPKKERLISSSEKKFTNVYVKNLASSITDKRLNDIFAAYGRIQSAVVMKDAQGKSKEFGFVNFEEAEDAAKAVKGLNGTTVDDRELVVCRAQKKAERETSLRIQYNMRKEEQRSKYDGVNVYIKNLDDDINDTSLAELFKECGTITSAKVMCDAKGNSKGFGFVCFSSPEEANKAIAMNGKMAGSKPLFVALAQRKEVRQKQLELHFARGRAMPGRLGMIPGGAAMFFSNFPNMYNPAQMNMARGRGMMAGPMPTGQPAPFPGQMVVMPGGRGKAPQSGRRKQMPPQVDESRTLAEEVYNNILRVQPERAAKITGMLLESQEDLRDLLQHPEKLHAKVSEAMQVLLEYEEQQKEKSGKN